MTPEIAELAHMALEKALNAALAADPQARDALQALQGQRIRIEMQGLFSFDLLPLADRLVVAARTEDPADASLRATPLGFLRAKMRGNLMQHDLELLGDSHTSLRAARLFSSLQPDIERALTPKIGGLLAHQIARLWNAMRTELKRLVNHHLHNKADFLHDEIDVTPRQSELEPWMDQVDQLQNRIEALDARLRKLEAAR